MLNSTSNAIQSHCYSPDNPETPGIQPVDLKSCNDALAVLVRTPDFTTRFRFSRNPRAMAIKIPTGWLMGQDGKCRIIINCQNDRDTGVFRYADIAQKARRIIDNCVNHPDPFGHYPMLNWGGVDGILGEDTFYVAVAKPMTSLSGVEIVNLSVLGSGESVDSGIESS